jgi:hypothetical protein
VVTVLEQFAAPGHVGSPPPETVAELVNVLPLAAAVGVTGITKLTGEPVARPAAIMHVTDCPDAVQPAGKVPSVKVPGMLSLTDDGAVVAALPIFVTVNV